MRYVGHWPHWGWPCHWHRWCQDWRPPGPPAHCWGRSWAPPGVPRVAHGTSSPSCPGGHSGSGLGGDQRTLGLAQLQILRVSCSGLQGYLLQTLSCSHHLETLEHLLLKTALRQHHMENCQNSVNKVESKWQEKYFSGQSSIQNIPEKLQSLRSTHWKHFCANLNS